MFNKKDPLISKSNEVNALLGKESEFEGKLAFSGTVRLDGKFTGEISSEGQLIIGDGAVVKAEINVDTAIIGGQVDGNITANTRIEVRAPGRVNGNIQTPILIIEEGVVFDGSCLMSKSQMNPISLVEKDEGMGEVETGSG